MNRFQWWLWRKFRIPPLLEFWWRARGVTIENYRERCKRCGQTGQAHYGLASLLRCWRFR